MSRLPSSQLPYTECRPCPTEKTGASCISCFLSGCYRPSFICFGAAFPSGCCCFFLMQLAVPVQLPCVWYPSASFAGHKLSLFSGWYISPLKPCRLLQSVAASFLACCRPVLCNTHAAGWIHLHAEPLVCSLEQPVPEPPAPSAAYLCLPFVPAAAAWCQPRSAKLLYFFAKIRNRYTAKITHFQTSRTLFHAFPHICPRCFLFSTLSTRFSAPHILILFFLSFSSFKNSPKLSVFKELRVLKEARKKGRSR